MALGDAHERSFLILKRQLQALNYTDHLDVSSSDLVQNLVDDLVRTTESYQTLKQQNHDIQHEAAVLHAKVCACSFPSWS
jgi:centrosomal protein CEP135